MTTDVKLGDNWVEVEGDALVAYAADIQLDGGPGRRGEHQDGWRRALVHNRGDQLTINYAGDYTGGVGITTSATRTLTIKNGYSGGIQLVFGTDGASLNLAPRDLTLKNAPGQEINMGQGGISLVAFGTDGASLNLAPRDLTLKNAPGQEINMGQGGISLASAYQVSISGASHGVSLAGQSVSINTRDGVNVEANGVAIKGQHQGVRLQGDSVTINGAPASSHGSEFGVKVIGPLQVQSAEGAQTPAKIALKQEYDALVLNADGGYTDGVRLEGRMKVISGEHVMTMHRHELVLTNETILARTVSVMGEETLDLVSEVRQLRQAVADLAKRVAQLESGS